jgi:hypothetical protein
MVPGHHQPLSRRHSDAATGLTVPDNVLRLPRGPDPSAGRGFRNSQFAQWTQPNRFQQKGRSGSVPTVVFTRYAAAGGAQPYIHPNAQMHQEMDMSAYAGMEQHHQIEQPQYMYRAPIQITHPPVEVDTSVPPPSMMMQQEPVRERTPITIEAPPPEPASDTASETILETPAAEAAAEEEAKAAAEEAKVAVEEAKATAEEDKAAAEN